MQLVQGFFVFGSLILLSTTDAFNVNRTISVSLHPLPIQSHPRLPEQVRDLDLNRTFDSDTVPKVKLFETCSDNLQCPDKSYCGIFEEFSTSVCACNDGLISSSDNTTCFVMYECSVSGFNPTYDKADCPEVLQFCEHRTCKCRPNYAYNSEERCVWDVPDQPEPINSRVQFSNLQIDREFKEFEPTVNAIIAQKKEQRNKEAYVNDVNGWKTVFIVSGVSILLVGVACVALGIYLKRSPNLRRPQPVREVAPVPGEQFELLEPLNRV